MSARSALIVAACEYCFARGMRPRGRLFLLLAGALGLAACTTEPPVVVAVAGRPSIVEPVLHSFAPEVTSKIEPVPIAKATEFDVLWDEDARRALQLKAQGQLAPLPAELRERRPDGFRDPDGFWVAMTADVRVIAFDPRAIDEDEAPTRVRELAEPRWRSLLVMGDPKRGSSAWHAAALAAAGKENTVAELAAGGAVALVDRERDVMRAVTEGGHPLALVDGEQAFAARERGHRVGIFIPDQDEGGAIVRASVVALSKRGAANADARKLVAYLLSAPVSRRLALMTSRVLLLPEDVPTGGSLRLADFKSLPVAQGDIAKQALAAPPFGSTPSAQ